jgi:3-phosphoshikimate 1-carboxyvinyltransferase
MPESGAPQKDRGELVVGPGLLRGDLFVPQSKSIAHRAVICSSLARRSSADGAEERLHPRMDRIDTGPESSLSMDIATTRDAMVRLLSGGTEVYCGESGSTLRFLIPVAAALGQTVTFTGSGRLPERPLAEYERILEGKGVRLEFPESRERFLPLRIHGRLQPGTFCVPGNVSSQYITGLLLALPLLPGDSTIQITSPLESAAYIDLTLDVMQAFGVHAMRDPRDVNIFRIPGGQQYRDVDYTVEGDYSQAAFWLTANLLGSRITLQGLNPASSQGDRMIHTILEAFRRVHDVENADADDKDADADDKDADADDKDTDADADDKANANVKTDANTHTADADDKAGTDAYNDGEIVVDASQIPDLVPILCVAAANTPIRTRIVHAERLRLKESDRIASSVSLINAIGGHAQETADGIFIVGSDTPLRGGRVDSVGDHRIAMAAAIAATVTLEGVTITDARCVNKSYPTFFMDMTKVEGVVYGIDVRKES